MIGDNKKRKVILYSNQPVVKIGDKFRTKMRNFIDFLNELSHHDEMYSLVVPCGFSESKEYATDIELNESAMLVRFYNNHRSAIIASFINAIIVRKKVRSELSCGHNVIVAGPGPNSFLFWLSFMLPKNVKYAFFVRGDTVRTVGFMYKNSIFRPLFLNAVKLFRQRIRFLLKSHRATVFLYGDKLKSQYPGNDDLVHVIYPLIDKNVIRDPVLESEKISEKFKVLYLGRFSEEKNIINLVKACALAKQSGNDFDLTLVGHGPLLSAIINKVQQTDMQDIINVVGYLPHNQELFDQLDSHDILCLPSFTEGVPRVIVEALARGLPVLATPVGSVSSLFQGHVKFIDGFDSHAINSAIQWCIENREEHAEMTNIGHNNIKRFLLESNAASVNKIIHEFSQNANA